MSFLDTILAKIPKLDKFCFMFDLYLSVKWTAVVLAAIHAIYFIQALIWFVGGGLVWAIIWSLANVVAFGLVFYGLMKNNKTLLLPAMIICVLGFFIDILNGIINFVFLYIFGAIWMFVMAGLVGYYFIALYNVWKDMSGGSGVATGGDSSKQTVNPA